MLFIGHGRRFTRCSRDDNGICAARNLVLDDASKFRKVDARLCKRCDNSDARAAENNMFHGNVSLP